MNITAAEGFIFVYTAKGANKMRLKGVQVDVGDPVNREGGSIREVPFEWIKTGMVGTKKININDESRR